MVRLFMMPPRLLIPRQAGRVSPSFHRARVRTRVVDYSTTTRLVHSTSRAPAPDGPGAGPPSTSPDGHHPVTDNTTDQFRLRIRHPTNNRPFSGY
jgi:hypothetical protein